MEATRLSTGALVELDAGVCGHTARVRAIKTSGYRVKLSIESTCPHVSNIADDLDEEIDALRQIGLREGLPPVLETAYRHCAHAACPVPAGVIKAIEVAAGLALPRDATMRITHDSSDE